jgi:hypothetical protein
MGGCSILLRYDSKIIGKTKYWIIISTPLALFVVSIYPTILSIPTGSFVFYDQDLIACRILFRFAGTIGGIFVFSVALLSVAKSMRMIKRESNRNVGCDMSTLPNVGKYEDNESTEEVGGTSSLASDYMSLSAYGVVMLAVTVQASIVQSSYPPFGVLASSFVHYHRTCLAWDSTSLQFLFPKISNYVDLLENM